MKLLLEFAQYIVEEAFICKIFCNYMYLIDFFLNIYFFFLSLSPYCRKVFHL